MFPLICTWINSWANDREAWFEAPSLTSWHERNAPAQKTTDSKFVLVIRCGNNNENVVTIWSKSSHTYLSPLPFTLSRQRKPTWWRHLMETFSALLAICVENSPVIGDFPAQRSVTRNLDVSFDLYLNKQLSKRSWGVIWGAIAHIMARTECSCPKNNWFEICACN